MLYCCYPNAVAAALGQHCFTKKKDDDIQQIILRSRVRALCFHVHTYVGGRGINTTEHRRTTVAERSSLFSVIRGNGTRGCVCATRAGPGNFSSHSESSGLHPPQRIRGIRMNDDVLGYVEYVVHKTCLVCGTTTAGCTDILRQSRC